MRERIGSQPSRWSIHNALAETLSPELAKSADALVIGGSGRFSVHHPESSPFVNNVRNVVERALSDGTPGFGICFGHQLVGLHLGAEVVTDMDRRESGTIELSLTDAGHHDPLFSHLGPTFMGHTGHTDTVTAVPPGATLLARSSTVEAQAFRVNGTRFYTTQFHPDLTGEHARPRYRAFAESLPPAEAARVERDVEGFDVEADCTHDLLERFLELAETLI